MFSFSRLSPLFVFLQFLFISFLVSADEIFTQDQDTVIRTDTYAEDLSPATNFIYADLLDSDSSSDGFNHAVYPVGPFDLDGSLFSGSGCSSHVNQLNGKLRSRGEQCDNPPTAALTLPSLNPEQILENIQSKPSCDDGEENVCCTGEEIGFWNGFRSILPDCTISWPSFSLPFPFPNHSL